MVFRFGVMLMFFTSMSKVLVPGAVFDPLQHELGLDAAVLGGLNAWYMSAYALSQFSIGILADRWGGSRVLLLGSISFCIGMTMFPLCSSIWLLRIARILAGFGAGIVFLGVAKLIADLYPERFSTILGFSLVISYLGPVLGTAPMVWLVANIGWRWALLVPALLAVFATFGILSFTHGTLQPLTQKYPVWRPVIQVMGNFDMVRLCVASSVTFGSYYALLTVMGRKCLEDAAGFQVKWAALLISALTIIVAVCNLMGGAVSKAVRNHYGWAMASLSALSLLAVSLGWLTLHAGLPGELLGISYIVICIPAGFFPVYSTMAKDASPARFVTLAVALVNFWAFVAISLVGYLAGLVMRSYEDVAQKVGEVLVYPVQAYEGVFIVFIVFAAIGLLSTIGLFRHPRKAEP